LIMAAQHGYREIIDRLLQVPGINVNVRNTLNMTASHTAGIFGRIEIEILLRQRERES